MPALIQRYATPLITGLFIVSLVSGVALFFHVGQAYFHGMHEWLSMILASPAEEVAPLLNLSTEEFAAKLAASGFPAPAPGQSLADLAKASGKSDMELAGLLVQARK
jgi:hypothetical protein